jgi:hypothetical protein
LLSTPSYDDAVTVGFQPVEHLVESVFTSSSDALSGALAPGFQPGVTGDPLIEPAKRATEPASLCVCNSSVLPPASRAPMGGAPIPPAEAGGYRSFAAFGG